MRFVDEFRQAGLIGKAAEEIRRLVDSDGTTGSWKFVVATRMPFIASA